MGNLLQESHPPIKGESPDIKGNDKVYFDRVNTILHNNYQNNLYSDSNLVMSLELKSFITNPVHPGDVNDISWLDYIYNYISNEVINNKHYPWGTEMIYLLDNEHFLSENKFDSLFFYSEYKIKTMPQILTNEVFDERDSSVDVDMFNNPLMKGPNNNMDELDITDNLGGSYIELNIDDLLPDDPTVKYRQRRLAVKKYIKIFKEHVYNNNEHPINRIINLFVRIFCKYINENLKEFESQLKKKEINGEEYNNKLRDFEKNITSSLQDFITNMHCALKLFYSTVIDYSGFGEEKDDLMNMLITLFFKTGSLYETIYNLYSLAFSKEIQDLQEKLINLRNVKPKNLGIPVKFCLDEDSLELQKTILKEKRAEKEKNEKNNNNEKNNINEKNNKNNDLGQINEEEDKDENDNLIQNPIKINNEVNDGNNNITTGVAQKQNNELNNEPYLLEKITTDFLDSDYNSSSFAGFTSIRNTINSFNSKKFLFPKLHNKLRDTIGIKDQYINEVKEGGKLPIPYFSAIKLLKNLKKFKAPFEKIVLIAAISDQITECASSFWSEMEKYIKNSFLFIEADEIMSIFLFIMIRSQMPEIIIFSKIITNFTTPSTRAFNISYNYTLMEASLEYISSLKDVDKLLKMDNESSDVRKSIRDITNQRLSRISRVTEVN